MSAALKIIAPVLAAVLAVGSVAPAMAQPSPHRESSWKTPNREAAVRSDIAALRGQVDRAAARRTISQREATGLRRDVSDIQRLHSSYARGGLNSREMQILQSRIDRVHFALHDERRDRDGRRG